MKDLINLLILITILNCIQLITTDELLELSCLSKTECKQFESSDIKTSCIKEQCQCNTNNGEIVQCQPSNSKINNIIGEACPCVQTNTECDRQQNVCYCVQDYMTSSDKRRCIAKMAALGDKCEEDSQCQKSDFNAICHESKQCKCMDHFINNEGKCASIVGSKSLTLNDSQCQAQYGANTKYNNRTQNCICMPGYFATIDNSRCLKISKYLANCTESLQCIGTMGPGGKCMENLCQCAEKYIIDEKKDKEGKMTVVCTAVIERGHYCRLDEDCYQGQLNESEQSMHCFYGECNCKEQFYSYNERNCVAGGAASIEALIGLQCLFALLVLANKYMS